MACEAAPGLPGGFLSRQGSRSECAQSHGLEALRDEALPAKGGRLVAELHALVVVGLLSRFARLVLLVGIGNIPEREDGSDRGQGEGSSSSGMTATARRKRGGGRACNCVSGLVQRLVQRPQMPIAFLGNNAEGMPKKARSVWGPLELLAGSDLLKALSQPYLYD